MDVRKLIKSGNSSLLISLPSLWLTKNNLKKGDSVFLISSNNNLMISPFSTQEKKEDTLHIISKKPLFLIKEELKYCFLENKNLIKIKDYEGPKEDLINLINDLPGFEYEVKEDSVIVRNLLDKNTINPKKEFKQLLVINNKVLSFLENPDPRDFNDLFLMIKNMKRRSMIAESVINTILETPYVKNKYDIDYETAIMLRDFYTELPFIFDNELYLIKEISHLKQDLSNIFIDIRIILSTNWFNNSIELHQEQKVKLKSSLDEIYDFINRSDNPQEIRILSAIATIYQSLLRMVNA